jgi:hypothetical protein
MPMPSWRSTSEFVSRIGIYNQEIIRFPVQVALISHRGLGQNKMSLVFILPLDVLTGTSTAGSPIDSRWFASMVPPDAALGC